MGLNDYKLFYSKSTFCKQNINQLCTEKLERNLWTRIKSECDNKDAVGLGVLGQKLTLRRGKGEFSRKSRTSQNYFLSFQVIIQLYKWSEFMFHRL